MSARARSFAERYGLNRVWIALAETVLEDMDRAATARDLEGVRSVARQFIETATSDNRPHWLGAFSLVTLHHTEERLRERAGVDSSEPIHTHLVLKGTNVPECVGEALSLVGMLLHRHVDCVIADVSELIAEDRFLDVIDIAAGAAILRNMLPDCAVTPVELPVSGVVGPHSSTIVQKASAEGFEPPSDGFGDRSSPN